MNSKISSAMGNLPATEPSQNNLDEIIKRIQQLAAAPESAREELAASRTSNAMNYPAANYPPANYPANPSFASNPPGHGAPGTLQPMTSRPTANQPIAGQPTMAGQLGPLTQGFAPNPAQLQPTAHHSSAVAQPATADPARADDLPPSLLPLKAPAMANYRNTIPQLRGEDPALQAPAAPVAKTCRFGELTGDREEPFIPTAPQTLDAAGLNPSIVEELIMRFLLNRGEASGRQIADQIKLPFRLIDPVLNRLKSEQMTVYRGANSVNDYTHSLTDQGRDRARRYNLRTTYYGSAPVSLDEYCQAVKLQSIEGQHPKATDLARAFKDLLVCKEMLAKLGPAINSGRGMFLYGYPGNGKTSIAERVTQAFGHYVWIPRSVIIDGEIMRLFDPLMHELAEGPKHTGLLNDSSVDSRWVRIKRPTIVAGGELTMAMLEVQKDAETNINEAPLQLKSNCGVLVIDDFGRQRMRVDELLNRWIVPLEKPYDFLNMTSGKKTQVPFDQLVIFSTNLQPKDLVDDAFLRRIPYKIEVPNPSEIAFRKLFEIMAPKVGLPYRADAVDHLVAKHYLATKRPFRNCHPRDLLLQVRNYCQYNDLPMDMLPEYFDYACDNYFSIM